MRIRDSCVSSQAVRLLRRSRVEAATSPPTLPVPLSIWLAQESRLGTLEVDGRLLAWSGSRDAAMSLPTVASCRNLICGTVAQLDVQRTRAGEVLDAGPLLTRPDPDQPWPVTIAETIDDLLFYGRAYWLILAYDGQRTDRNPFGMPVRARRVPAPHVERRLSRRLSDYSRVEGYEIGGNRVPAESIIAFDAGHEGVLRYGSATIGASLALEAAARRLSNVELPAGVLENTGSRELDEIEAAALVAGFQAARRANGIAYLQGIKYNREGLDSEDLQLVEARAQAATDQARLFSVPVALVAASPTGGGSALLYANLTSTQASLLTLAVGPYLRVVEAALSDERVTPRGQRVNFTAGQWLRTDPAASADFVVKLKAAELITDAEGRGFMGLPPTPAAAADLTPGRV